MVKYGVGMLLIVLATGIALSENTEITGVEKEDNGFGDARGTANFWEMAGLKSIGNGYGLYKQNAISIQQIANTANIYRTAPASMPYLYTSSSEKVRSATLRSEATGDFAIVQIGSLIADTHDILVPVTLIKENTNPSALFLDFEYDTNSMRFLKVIAGPAIESAQKSVFCAFVGNSFARVIIGATNNNTLADGVLCYLAFHLQSSQPEPEPLVISGGDASGADPNAQRITVIMENGQIDTEYLPVLSMSFVTPLLAGVGIVLAFFFLKRRYEKNAIVLLLLITLAVNVYAEVPCDVNGSGNVDQRDLDAVVSHALCTASFPAADVDNSLVVDAVDYQLVTNALVNSVRINEVVTWNVSGTGAAIDEDGQRKPWIELYNPSNAAISLESWKLTNDPALADVWTIPNIILPAHGYKLVFCSGKNRSSVSYPHTDFAFVPDTAGYVALLKPDGTPVSEQNYPALYTDWSWSYFSSEETAAKATTAPDDEGQKSAKNTPEKQNELITTVTVVLDPGHGEVPTGDSATTGRSDVGTTSVIYGHIPEWKFVWVIAQELKQALESDSSKRYKVVITKSAETTNLNNRDRASKCGNENANLFLSLHFNGTEASQSYRGTMCLVLPVGFDETIGGVLFKTENRNQSEEIDFSEGLATSVYQFLETIPHYDEPKLESGDSDGTHVRNGVRFKGTSANKGVLFETSPERYSNTGIESGRKAYWEERLYHYQVDYAASKDISSEKRAIATLLEIDYLTNPDVCNFFAISENGDLVNDLACRSLAYVISNYIKVWFSK